MIMVYGFLVSFIIFFIFGIIFTIIRQHNYGNFKSSKNDYNLTDYASEKEKMLLQPIITSKDTPKIISNGNGSFYSDKRIEGESNGTLALTRDERLSLANSGWHDTGLVNGHGQPLVQNDEGKILSVCRSIMTLNYFCYTNFDNL